MIISKIKKIFLLKTSQINSWINKNKIKPQTQLNWINNYKKSYQGLAYH